VVTADPQEAAAALARHEPVVLIVDPDSVSGPARPGRLAVLVGDPDDPVTTAAAREMEAELYARDATTSG
jgi:hypothetical protein